METKKSYVKATRIINNVLKDKPVDFPIINISEDNIVTDIFGNKYYIDEFTGITKNPTYLDINIKYPYNTISAQINFSDEAYLDKYLEDIIFIQKLLHYINAILIPDVYGSNIISHGYKLKEYQYDYIILQIIQNFKPFKYNKEFITYYHSHGISDGGYTFTDYLDERIENWWKINE